LLRGKCESFQGWSWSIVLVKRNRHLNLLQKEVPNRLTRLLGVRSFGLYCEFYKLVCEDFYHSGMNKNFLNPNTITLD